MRTVIVAGIVGLLCAGGAAGAQEAGPGVSMQTADVVAGRKAAMALSGAAMSGMKATIDAGGPVRSQAFAAGGLARWGRAVPGMFPAGWGAADLAGARPAQGRKSGPAAPTSRPRRRLSPPRRRRWPIWPGPTTQRVSPPNGR